MRRLSSTSSSEPTGGELTSHSATAYTLAGAGDAPNSGIVWGTWPRVRAGRLLVAALVWVVVLSAVMEGQVRLARRYFGNPAHVHKPLSAQKFTPKAEFIPGVDEKTTFWIDENGLRPERIGDTRTPNVLALGSSTMECMYLDQTKAFGAQIGAALRAHGQGAVVTTAAKSGMLAWHSAEYARDILPKMPSIRVVIAMPGATDMNTWLRGSSLRLSNDMRRATYAWPATAAPDRSVIVRDRVSALVRSEGKKLLAWLQLSRFFPSEGGLDATGEVHRRWREQRAKARKVDAPADRVANLDEALAIYRENLIELVRACQTRNVECVFLTQSLLYSPQLTGRAKALWWSGALGSKATSNEYLSEAAYAGALERFNDVTRAVAREFDCPLVDLAKLLRDDDGQYYYDTLHFNNAGAAAAAEIVAQALMGLLRLSVAEPDLRVETVACASSVDPAIDRLSGRVFYRESWRGERRPMLVLMHGFQHDADAVRDAACFARSQGFVAVTPNMRGRGASAGEPDYGGVEICDIVDVISAVRAKCGDFVDPNDVSIEGFSGGGGNVLSAVTKFPDMFRAGIAWFGISDYGYDRQHGWYFQTNEQRRALLRARIGDASGDGDEGAAGVVARYMSRASVLGAATNVRSVVHLFHDRGDAICPLDQSVEFADAVGAGNSSVEPGLESPVRLHISEDGRWAHGYPSWSTLRAAHEIIWPAAGEGRSGSRAVRAAANTMTWTVLGYLRAEAFFCWLGDGANAVARLTFAIEGDAQRFAVSFVSAPVDWRIEVFTGADRRSRELLCQHADSAGGDSASPRDDPGAWKRVAVATPVNGVAKFPVLRGDQKCYIMPIGDENVR